MSPDFCESMHCKQVLLFDGAKCNLMLHLPGAAAQLGLAAIVHAEHLAPVLPEISKPSYCMPVNVAGYSIQ